MCRFCRMDPTRIRLLLFDPRREFAGVFGPVLRGAGYGVGEARTEESALAWVEQERPNIIIKPNWTKGQTEGGGRRPPGLMERLRSLGADAQFIFVHQQSDVHMAMEAMRRGAFDCLPLPCPSDQLLESVQRALEHQRLVAEDAVLLARLAPRKNPNILTGESAAMRAVQEVLERVAGTDVTVLIEGESGTGKELAARLLHERSRRAEGPFLAVNCAALPEQIIESELFGHVKGAFTGAITDKPGRFELAAGGTLFLDEIGDLSPLGQADLLRVLEDGIFRPIGSRTTRKADVRIVAATNHNLEEACQAGKFREDLLYRLNVITVRLPPLRERPDDLALLCAVFLQHFCSRHGRPLKRLSSSALQELARRSWPGNVRQLRNVIERMVLLEPARSLEKQHLPPESKTEFLPSDSIASLDTLNLRQARQWLVRRAVARCRGNKAAAARQLGISRRALHYEWARLMEEPSSVQMMDGS